MLSQESGEPNNNNSNSNIDFDLPEEVLQVLPRDPFEQLDVARKITSIALSTRVSSLESETSVLRHRLTEKDAIIADLLYQMDSLDAALSDASDKLARAEKEKEDLLEENDALSNTVKKLNRDVAKLEAFRKTLVRSLQDDEDHSVAGPPIGVQERSQTEDDASLPPTSNPMQSQFSDTGNSYSEDNDTKDSRPRISPGLLLASQTSTPQLTPPGSPPGQPPGQSASGSDTGAQSGRTRVDAKDFFRQVRSRLPYQQFGAFLANVKGLNSHKQTKEETLQKADEIFGPENKDLYAIFEGLITRNVHWKE